MKKVKILIAIAVFALSTCAFAQQGAPVKADTTVAETTLASPKPGSPSQNKQTSVSRPTKKTNWSKIKTMFE